MVVDPPSRSAGGCAPLARIHAPKRLTARNGLFRTASCRTGGRKPPACKRGRYRGGKTAQTEDSRGKTKAGASFVVACKLDRGSLANASRRAGKAREA